MRCILFPVLVLALAGWCMAATWGTWNNKTVGTSSGNVSSLNGKTIGMAAGNYNAWNGLAAPSADGPAVDMGLSFRTTVGYVTDQAYAVFVDPSTDAYPQTHTNGNGVSITHGYTIGGESGSDRNNTVDARLAGVHYTSNSGSTTFRVDLPSTGTWTICAAFGDIGFSKLITAQLQDNTTTFKDLTNSGAGIAVTAGHFVDASGATVSSTAWLAGTPCGGTAITHTFTSTIFRLVQGNTSAIGGASAVTHLRFQK